MRKLLLCAVTAGLLTGCSGGGGGSSGGGTPNSDSSGAAASAINQLNSPDTQQAVDNQPFPFMTRAVIANTPGVPQAAVALSPVAQLIALGPAAVDEILNEFRKTPTLSDDAYLSVLAYVLERIGDKRAIPVLAAWLDNNMFVGFPGWVTDFVTHTLKVLGGQGGLNTTTFTYFIDEKYDTLLQSLQGAQGGAGTTQALMVAKGVPQGVINGVLTPQQQLECTKNILITGVNPAGQEVTLKLTYKVVARDINDIIADPGTSQALSAMLSQRVKAWGETDAEIYNGSDYIPASGAIITNASNCAGSVIEKIVNQLTGKLGIPINLGRGASDADQITNVAQTFGNEVAIADIDPLTVIALGRPGGGVGHVEVPVSVNGSTAVIQSKFDYGLLRFHTINTNSLFPDYTQFQATVNHLGSNPFFGSGGVSVKFYRIDPARIKRIVVDSSQCPCTPGDPNGIPVEITQPTGDQTADRVITVEGTAGSGDSTVLSGTTLSVNGNPQNIAVANGSFTASVVLQSGPNVIKVSVEGVDGRRGCAVKTITSTTPKTTLSATLTWDLDQADLDLYVTQPDGQTAWYQNLQTTSGGRLDVDNTQGFGPENYFVSFGPADSVGPGPYKIAVHYYSDHQKNANQPTRPAVWRVVLLINEGTPGAKYQVFTGTLSADNSDNYPPGSSGSDWAPVTTVNVTAAGP